MGLLLRNTRSVLLRRILARSLQTQQERGREETTAAVRQSVYIVGQMYLHRADHKIRLQICEQ